MQAAEEFARQERTRREDRQTPGRPGGPYPRRPCPSAQPCLILRRYRRDSLRSIQYASAPMAVALLRDAMATFGPIFTQVYGMT